MPSLNVNYCIVCEDVRPEARGKHAILGFFGLLPHVNIKIGELGKGLAKLVFLMNIEGEPGKYNFTFSLFGPDGKQIGAKTALPSMEIFEDPKKRALAAINLVGVTFTKEGIHKIRMSSKSKVFYEGSFGIEQTSEEEL